MIRPLALLLFALPDYVLTDEADYLVTDDGDRIVLVAGDDPDPTPPTIDRRVIIRRN